MASEDELSDDMIDLIARRALEEGPPDSDDPSSSMPRKLPTIKEATESVVPITKRQSSGAVNEPTDYAEKLSNLLEQNCTMMRRNMTDFFREARASFLKEQRQAVDAERRSAQQAQSQNHEDTEFLKDELAVAQNAAEKAGGLVWRACCLVSRLQEQQRERNWLQRLYVAWRTQHRWGKRKQFLKSKADRWRQEEWYMRRTLRTMWANVARKKKKCVDQRVDQVRADTAAAVAKAKDEEAEGLRQQLLDTKRALAAEKHARESLAQDMKRSFMRGVCALNMEAMQVMKRGQAPDGMNPNPTVFPVGTAAASECGDPEPEAVPESVYKHLQASMSASGGAASGIGAAASLAPGQASASGYAPSRGAVSKAGSHMSGFVVREARSTPSPHLRESAPRPPPLSQLPQYKNLP